MVAAAWARTKSWFGPRIPERGEAMRTTYVVIVGMLMASCAPVATHTVVGNRRYAIGIEGGAPANAGEAQAVLHRHAARICPHGYDVVSATSSQQVGATMVADVPVVSSRPDGALVVDCRTAEASAADAADAGATSSDFDSP